MRDRMPGLVMADRAPADDEFLKVAADIGESILHMRAARCSVPAPPPGLYCFCVDQ